MRNLGLTLVFLLVMVLAYYLTTSSNPKNSSAAAENLKKVADAAENPKKAAEAAEIGDIVTIRYPASTIMCEDPLDSSKVYIAGLVALRQTLGVENDASKAVDAMLAAQKAAMDTVHSCQWAPRKVRYVVKNKKIEGGDRVFSAAKYCLKPTNGIDDTCSWIEEMATMSAQIDKEVSK
jgi:hypothetical protein